MAHLYVSRETEKNIIQLEEKYLAGKLEEEVGKGEIVAAAMDFIMTGLKDGSIGIERVGESHGKSMINFINVEK